MSGSTATTVSVNNKFAPLINEQYRITKRLGGGRSSGSSLLRRARPENIVPGQPALGMPKPGAKADSAGRFKKYDNNNWDWRHCLGKLINLPNGCKAPAHIVIVEENDSRITVACAHCEVPIVVWDNVISSWSSLPLHARVCAKAVSTKYQHQFKEGMLVAGVPKGAFDMKDLGFDF